MIVKVIPKKSKGVKGIFEGQRDQISSILFNIN